jgi:hypothetical protein
LDRCAILCRFQLGGLRQTDRSFRSFAFWLVVDHFEFPTLDLATGFEQLGFKRNPGFRIQLLLDLINDPLFQVAYFHELPLFDVQPLADLVEFRAPGSGLRTVPGAAHLIKRDRIPAPELQCF